MMFAFLNYLKNQKFSVNKLICLLALSSLLSACGTLSSMLPRNLNEEAEQHSNFLEQYEINSIFHNIFRAAYNEPLTFMTIQGLNGSFNNSLSLNPGTTIGDNVMGSITGNVNPLSVNLSAQSGNNANYNINVLDSALFSQYYLTKIPLQYAEFFTDNHRPKELVHILLIDSITITNSNGTQQKYDNNPLLVNYQEFQDQLYKLIGYGLSPYKVDSYELVGPPISEASLTKAYGPNFRVALDNEGFLVTPSISKNISVTTGPNFQIIKKSMPKLSMCIPRGINDEQVRKTHGPSLFCESASDPVIKRLEQNDDRKISIVFRSTSQVFDFLGEVVRAQLDEPSYMVTLPPITPPSNFRVPRSSYALFPVMEVSSLGSNNYAQIKTLMGKSYAIPMHDDGYARMTLKMVSQILKLSYQPGVLPQNQSPIIINSIR